MFSWLKDSMHFDMDIYVYYSAVCVNIWMFEQIDFVSYSWNWFVQQSHQYTPGNCVYVERAMTHPFMYVNRFCCVCCMHLFYFLQIYSIRYALTQVAIQLDSFASDLRIYNNAFDYVWVNSLTVQFHSFLPIDICHGIRPWKYRIHWTVPLDTCILYMCFWIYVK